MNYSWVIVFKRRTWILFLFGNRWRIGYVGEDGYRFRGYMERVMNKVIKEFFFLEILCCFLGLDVVSVI